MRYIQESLVNQEKIIYASRPHWIVFGPAVAILIVAFLVLGYLPSYIGVMTVWHGYSFHEIAFVVVLVLGLLTLIRAYITYMTSEYGVTNKRVIMKRGWIQRDTVEVFLQRIEAINVAQTVLGRILNYGTVMITGTGGTCDYYPLIPGPIKFRRVVQEQLSDAMGNGQ